MPRGFCAALAAALACVAAAPAQAHEEKYRASVTINDNSFTRAAAGRAAARNYTFEFFGEVRSPKPACERGRQVRLVDMNADNANEAPPAVVGQDTTDSTGYWEIAQSNKPQADLYVAKARAKALRRGDGHRHVCAKAASRRYFFYPF